MPQLSAFCAELPSLLSPSSRLHTDELLVSAYSADASPFSPRAAAVADVASLDDVRALLACAAKHGVGLTFRGAGTGLCGQSLARDVTVRLTGEDWRGITVLDGGARVRAGCHATGGEVNAALRPYGRVLSADPSSIASATLGGMTATNAAGLSCAVPENIYHCLDSLSFVLADGTAVDTADAASVAAFRASHAELLAGLAALRARVLENELFSATVRRKFAIRNTSGYSLNALVDFEDPLDILTHLLVGSEGTLALLRSVTLRTAPLRALRATALVGFPSLDDAIQGVLRLASRCPMRAVEFLDTISLDCLSPLPNFPEALRQHGPEGCALLLETAADSPEELAARMAAVRDIVRETGASTAVHFATEAADCEALWNIRRSLFPMLARMRAAGEYIYAEDYCVPVRHLPQACRAFAEILARHGFGRSGINGHALHGNLHFTAALALDDADAVARLGRVIDEAAAVVLELGGSLKAEHGTGRAIAPFLRQEWGDGLFAVMRDIKDLLDPRGILNPEVIFNDDPHCHLSGLKSAAPVDEAVDLCVDCGFCEYVCPTARVGLTARQRIYALRRMAALRAAGETERANRWEASFRRWGRDICSGDGLCARRCPLGIDTGAYMKRLRHAALTPAAHWTARQAGEHFTALGVLASAGLKAVAAVHGLLGHELAQASGRLAGAVSGMTLPDFREALLTGGSAVPRGDAEMNRAVLKKNFVENSAVPHGPVVMDGAPHGDATRNGSTPRGTMGNTEKDSIPASSNAAPHGTMAASNAMPTVVYYPSCAVRLMGYSDAAALKSEPLMEVTLRLLRRAGYRVILPEPRETAHLCCGKAFESKGLFEEADAKSRELELCLLALSEGGRWPVLCDTSPCLARMKQKMLPALSLYEPVQFTLEFLADKLTFTRKTRRVALHPTCSMRQMGLEERFREVALRCVTEAVLPEKIFCCGFSGDKGFSHPAVNAAALATLRTEIAGCTEGYSASRTCEVGLSVHGGVPYRNILYLIEECTR